MAGQMLAVADFSSSDYDELPDMAAGTSEANVMTSKIALGYDYGTTSLHRPVLDIDLPVKVLPSTTEGHFHLFIEKAMTWEQYQRLMDVLVDVGIVEAGYVKASKQRGYSAVRLPWVRKEEGVVARGY